MAYSITSTPSGTSIKQDGVEVATISPTGDWSFKDAGVVKPVTDIAKDGSIGSGQGWQILTGSRSANTVYTNTTGKPIYVYVFQGAATATSTTQIVFTVNGVVIQSAMNTNSSGGVGAAGGMLIPAGATYSVNTASSWWELR